MPKIFAEGYPRTEQGWVKFPSDVKRRKEMFPPSVMKHLAKMHMYLEEALIEYVSDPDDIILDPMSGTGTVMMAATMARTVICLEIEDFYHNIQQEVLTHLSQRYTMAPVVLLHGNCKLLLPIPCDHIIFSPPYAAAFKPPKEITQFQKDKYRVTQEEIEIYARSTGNVGLYNTFIYNQQMSSVYKLCAKSIRKGGTLSVVCKDIIEGGKRNFLSKWIVRECEANGMKQTDWFKMEMLGGPYQDMRRSRGQETVDEEDAIIFTKL
jgi:hypothetical protein